MPITLQGIKYDAKSSFQRGPANAPALIRQRFWSDAYNRYAENGKEILPSDLDDKGDFTITDYEDIEEITSKNCRSGNPLLTLGGDHSITYPVVKSWVNKHGPVEILHIDAHGDLYDIFEGDRFSHACPFARIMEDGLATRLVQVGIRTLTDHQRSQAQKFGVEIIEMKDFDGRLPQMDGPIYLSMDIDGFDPAFAPGVSHQESGGLTPREVIKMLHNLQADLVAADLVEFNPINDVGGITEALCAKLMKEILAKMKD